MKEILVLQAKYNKAANAAMMSIVAGLSDEKLDANLGLFYKNLRAELAHILGVQVAVFGGVFAKWAGVNCADILSQINEDLSLKNKGVASIAKLFAACDEKIIQIIEKTPELGIMDELSFPGITFKKSRANLILALLNHSTHHRGIVGAELELLGVSNDFNGMLGYEL